MLNPETTVAALEVDLALEAVPASQRIAGEPSTGFAELGEFDGVSLGVWEMTPGSMSDTETDEVFVVLVGSATVAFEGGATVSLSPGSVMRFTAGQRTVWTVTETLRKLYLA